MDLFEAQILAEEYISQYLGDSGWSFGWSRQKKAFGKCHYGYKKIYLSRILTAIESEESVENTILHEIAHAIAGFEAGHGEEWKRAARSIGLLNPTRTGRVENPSLLPDPKYVMVNTLNNRIVKEYYRRPSLKVMNTVHLYKMRTNPVATLGKIAIFPYEEYRRMSAKV